MTAEDACRLSQDSGPYMLGEAVCWVVEGLSGFVCFGFSLTLKFLHPQGPTLSWHRCAAGSGLLQETQPLWAARDHCHSSHRVAHPKYLS